MKNKNKIIIISIVSVIILLSIVGVFIFKGNREINANTFKALIDEEYMVESFNEDDNGIKINIIGDLNKDNITNLSEKISKIDNLNNVVINVFKEKVSNIENGYYNDGLLAQVSINNKNMEYSEFKEDKINEDIKDISITNAEYKNLENNNGIIKIYINSEELKVDNVKEELYLLSQVINSSNKDLKNVIITSKIGELEGMLPTIVKADTITIPIKEVDGKKYVSLTDLTNASGGTIVDNSEVGVKTFSINGKVIVTNSNTAFVSVDDKTIPYESKEIDGIKVPNF